MFLPIGDDIERDAAPFQFSTIIMFGICLAVFGWQFSLKDPQIYYDAIMTFGLTPAAILGNYQLPPHLALIPPELTLFTSMFIHADIMHFAGNMLFLWTFGSSLEEATGHIRFVILFLLCGLGAGIGQALVDPSSTIPMVGASGAISGVMGAYLLVYPFSRVRVMILVGFRFPVINVPALVVIGLWIALQIWEMLAANAAIAAGTADEGGVAWTAHVGGFVTGMLLIMVLRRPGVKLMESKAELV